MFSELPFAVQPVPKLLGITQLQVLCLKELAATQQSF